MLSNQFADSGELQNLAGKVGRWLSGAEDRGGGRKERTKKKLNLNFIKMFKKLLYFLINIFKLNKYFFSIKIIAGSVQIIFIPITGILLGTIFGQLTEPINGPKLSSSEIILMGQSWYIVLSHCCITGDQQWTMTGPIVNPCMGYFKI